MLPRKLKVLFLCTGNSCRSQMAEGWARALRGDSIEAYSAGIEARGLNPLAVRVMAEAGVDIARQRSKTVETVRHVAFDCVVTVCGHADGNCPAWLGRKAAVVHVNFDDPPELAKSAKTEKEALQHYRRVRDEIAAFIRTLPGALTMAGKKRKQPAQSCCGSGRAHDVREVVRSGYARIARTGSLSRSASAGGCCGTGGPCGTADDLAQQIGYSADEIRALPEGANMGLSCGNPTAIAGLKKGEIVLDLGSGGGFDVFLAGPKVGASGRVIGVDMTSEMIARARKNLASYRRRTGLDNVEFRLGEIEHLPVADASVDVVISNCVINLSTDKPQVWREIARVLRPGGRVAAADMALLRPLPARLAKEVEALIGCVAGAVTMEDYRRMVRRAGFAGISLRPKPGYVAALSDSRDPLYRRISRSLPAGTSAGDFITSIDATARKPE